MLRKNRSGGRGAGEFQAQCLAGSVPREYPTPTVSVRDCDHAPLGQVLALTDRRERSHRLPKNTEKLAGCTGLEPVASGVTGGLSGVAEPGNASQPLVISGTGAAEKRAVWQDFGGFRPPRVTPELQSPEVQGRPRPRFLSVREAAALLRVCTSTVYKLCAEGRLRHVRVSNAIRIPEGAIAACLHVE